MSHDSIDCLLLVSHKRENRILPIVEEVATELELSWQSANQLQEPGVVIDQIQAHIRAARVVIADLTDSNPNVYYETAIAHEHKGKNQVVLLAEADTEVPFDLKTLRYIPYEDTLNGGKSLRQRLKDNVKEALQASYGPLLDVIHGESARRERIVREYQLWEQKTREIASLVIRFEGALSPFALPDDEAEQQPVNERDAARAVLRKGARFRGILSPRLHLLRDTSFESSAFARRMRFLVAYLEGLKDTNENLELVLIEPGFLRSTLIFGDAVLFDGAKTRIGRGYGLTSRITDKRQVVARATAFDQLFEEAKAFTLKNYGDPHSGKSPSAVRAACVAGLRAIDEFHRGPHGPIVVDR